MRPPTIVGNTKKAGIAKLTIALVEQDTRYGGAVPKPDYAPEEVVAGHDAELGNQRSEVALILPWKGAAPASLATWPLNGQHNSAADPEEWSENRYPTKRKGKVWGIKRGRQHSV